MVLNRVLRHNLRNQLNLIEGHAESLEDDSVVEAEPHIQSIIDTVADLVQLSEKARQVDEILTDDLSTEPIEAAEVVQNRCHEFQARFPDIELSVDTPSSVWVQADPKLAIVIDNLLENAIKYSDQSVPTVTVSITASETSDETVELRVADNGPDIPVAEVESIVNGVETPLDHTSGLGLWCVKWLVDGYGGEVVFEDNSPRGNIVLARLKQADPPG